jgi:hypothetical protein
MLRRAQRELLVAERGAGGGVLVIVYALLMEGAMSQARPAQSQSHEQNEADRGKRRAAQMSHAQV